MTSEQKTGALRLAVRMREAQRQFFKSPPGSDDKRNAMITAKTLEAEFDRMMKGWEPDA